MVTPLLTAALTLSSLAPRLGAEEMLNVGWRNWNVRATGLSAPSSRDRDASKGEMRDGMVETFDCDTAGLPGQERPERRSSDTGR